MMVLLCTTLCYAILLVSTLAQVEETFQPPQLNGEHFRITVVEEGSFLTIDENKNGTRGFSGYLIDMLQALARQDRANFTYELLPPSGFGASCSPTLTDATAAQAYDARYRSQYHCGTNDVNDLHLNVNRSNFTTDMYLGLYYITPARQLRNHFTMPFSPPYKGTPAMFGTATGIQNIKELVELQAQGKQPPVCVWDSTAVLDFVQDSFPQLAINPFLGSEHDLAIAIQDGRCPVCIFDAPIAAQFVLRRNQKHECLDNDGNPIGIIGEPMSFGLSHYAIGIRRDLPQEVVDTISYWINVLMMCNPLEPNGRCPEGNLDSFFSDNGGTGKECGYVLYPSSGDDSLSGAQIAGITVGAVAFVVIVLAIPFWFWHRHRLLRQERRYKLRFVQQIARNVTIGPSPGHFSADKLLEQIKHIGNDNGIINKQDLAKWLDDVKMNFLSQEDFNALWDAMDIDGTGEVDAIEFVVFLSACGPEFEEVYNWQQDMPKSERLKLAARRLTNIAKYGEAGVRRNQTKLERRSREFPVGFKRLSSTKTLSHVSDC